MTVRPVAGRRVAARPVAGRGLAVGVVLAALALSACGSMRPAGRPAVPSSSPAPASVATAPVPDLARLRARLDSVDAVLLRAFAARQRLADAVADVKAQTGAPVRDAAREAVLLDARIAAGAPLGLSAADVRAVFEALLARSRARQAARLGRDD